MGKKSHQNNALPKEASTECVQTREGRVRRHAAASQAGKKRAASAKVPQTPSLRLKRDLKEAS